MKVVARLIDVCSWTDTKGQIHPLMLRLEENEEVKKLRLDKVVTVTKEKLAGNMMLLKVKLKGSRRAAFRRLC
jgi:hypothetical protein